MLLHICPEKKGGLESPAFCYFYFLVRGAICAGLSLSGGNGVADEMQIQASFAGCHAETFSRSWNGSVGIFFLIASAHVRVQQLCTWDLPPAQQLPQPWSSQQRLRRTGITSPVKGTGQQYRDGVGTNLMFMLAPWPFPKMHP